MQDINNKLAALLEVLTSFFEHFTDTLADVLAHQATMEAKNDTMISLLRTIEQNTRK